jgi:hypothetical protein
LGAGVGLTDGGVDLEHEAAVERTKNEAAATTGP